MGRNAQRIPHSALYTAATWRWAGLPCSDLVTPAGSSFLFHLVNIYVVMYRLINPGKYSLKHSLIHRHAIIDNLMGQSPCHQIVEIAAGFSPRGCMASVDPSCCYFEIDLPDVINLKRAQLQSSPAGNLILSRRNFNLLPVDILHFDWSVVCGSEPTFVISEGLMMYFHRETQMTIWRAIARFMAVHGGTYVFDYIPQGDEPCRSGMGKWLSRLRQKWTGASSPFAYDERTSHDIENDLREAGFARVEIIDSTVVAKKWSLPHASVKTHVLVFCCTQEGSV